MINTVARLHAHHAAHAPVSHYRVAAAIAQYALGFSGCAAGVQDVERVRTPRGDGRDTSASRCVLFY